MFKVFQKDLLDRQRIIKYFVYVVVSYAILDGFLKNIKFIEFNERFLIFLSIALLGSVFYYIRAYVGNDRILSYYALPVSRADLNLKFILSVIIDTVFSKLILVFIALYIFKAPNDIYIKAIYIMLITAMFALACNSLNLNLGKLALLFVASVLSLYIVINFNLAYGGLITLFNLFLSWFLLKDLYFSTKSIERISKLHIKNYFLKFFFAESVYIINTIGLIIMICFAVYVLPKEMGVVIATSLGAVNTPLLTMFSSSEELRDYDKMFPNSEISLRTNYRKLLSIYFVLINLFISILAYNRINSSYLLVANMIIISIIEIFVSYWLEIRKAITNTKTQNEIWKHPRKYILPIIVFFISFLILVIVK